MLPFGPFELFIILIIFFIFFGAGKLGDLGGAIRRGVSLFKQNAGIGEPDKKDGNKPVKG
jgi:Sec-independent protein translocase protein TatA